MAEHEVVYRNLKVAIEEGRRRKVVRLEGQEKGFVDMTDREVWSDEVRSGNEDEMLSDERTDGEEEEIDLKRRRAMFMKALNMEEVKRDSRMILKERRDKKLSELRLKMKSKSFLLIVILLIVMYHFVSY